MNDFIKIGDGIFRGSSIARIVKHTDQYLDIWTLDQNSDSESVTTINFDSEKERDKAFEQTYEKLNR